MNMNKETIEMAEQTTTTLDTTTTAAPSTDTTPGTPAAEPVPMFRLAGVDKVYTQKKRTVHALQRVDLTIAGRAAGRHPGPHRRRQVHAAADARRARPAHRRQRRAGRPDIATLSEAKLTRVRAENIGFVFQAST